MGSSKGVLCAASTCGYQDHLSSRYLLRMLPTIRPTNTDGPAEDTDEEMLGGGEETDERANLLGGKALLDGNFYRNKKITGGTKDSVDDEDDDFFLNGPKVKIAGLRSQVNEVTSVMRDNIGKVLERGQNLTELNQRSENLQNASESFRSQAERVRRKAWWDNVRTKAAIGGFILVILIIIIIIASK